MHVTDCARHTSALSKPPPPQQQVHTSTTSTTTKSPLLPPQQQVISMKVFLSCLALLAVSFFAEGKKKNQPMFEVVGEIPQPLLAAIFQASGIPIPPLFGVKFYRVNYPSLYKSGGKKKKSHKNNLSGLLMMPIGSPAVELPVGVW